MKDKTKIIIRGEITARFFRQTNPLMIKWNRFVEIVVKVLPQYRGWILKHFYSFGELVRVDKRTNVICNAGLARVTGGLANDLTLANINYMALGTGAPTPAVGDIKLATESYRNATASATHSGGICYATAYYTQTEVTGTFTEFGNFIEGSASADSGYIWSHIASISWVKDSVTTLTVDQKYVFTSS